MKRSRTVEWHELMKRRERKEYSCCVKTQMEGVKHRSGETSEVLCLGVVVVAQM